MAALFKREYWMLEMDCIHESHRSIESSLQKTRWFDYRRMTPAELTYLFAEHYWKQYLESYRETKDIRTVESILPFTPTDIFKSDDLTSMWLARQAADSLGCKYEFYLRHVFSVFTSRGWKNLPRPNQIYSEELTMSVTTAWKLRCKEVFQFADSKFYASESYVSHPDQVEYYQYLTAHINRCQNKYLIIGQLLQRKLMPHELAVEAFGVEICRRALMI